MVRALDDLERHAVMWLVGQGDFATVVLAACDVLAEGASGAALADLAGLSVREDRWAPENEAVMQAALAEQGRALPPRGTAEAQVLAVRAMCADAVAGRLAPRDLAAWTHTVVGHDGAAMAQPLVDLDDRYDVTEYTDERPDDLDREVLTFCRAAPGRSG